MDFSITSKGKVSGAFEQHGCSTFAEAIELMRQLPYGRNADKEDLLTVFADGCGTCSTKHALLKELASENGMQDLVLILCIFKMNRHNMPEVAPVLDKYALDYIPEAHNYLRAGGSIIDCTKPTFTIASYPTYIISEAEIQPSQITTYKVAYHKGVLQDWLSDNPAVPYSLDELFGIREECIAAL